MTRPRKTHLWYPWINKADHCRQWICILLPSLQISWILYILQLLWWLWHWTTCYRSHPIHGCSKKYLELPTPQHLEQIPTDSCHSHESTLVEMWNLVNEEIPFKQTGSFLTSKHSTYTASVNDESMWRRNMKRTHKENVLWHTLRLQHDRCPPIGLRWENSSWTIWQASTTNVDRMLRHCLLNWMSLPSQQRLHYQKSLPPLCQRTWSYHWQIWLPQGLDKGSITWAVPELIGHVPY